MNNDMLKSMFAQQEEFMKLLQRKRNFPQFPIELTSKVGQKLCKSIAYEAMGELFEAIQHLKNSKEHRATDINEINRNEFLEELIDSLHYFFEIAIICGISPTELYDAYMKKGDINYNRIEEGY